MATDAQIDAYETLHDRIEAAWADPSALGALWDEVMAGDLTDEDRASLQGTVGTYLADIAAMNDPLEQGGLTGPDTPEHPNADLGDDADALEDAAADAEDGFPIADGWRPAWAPNTQ